MSNNTDRLNFEPERRTLAILLVVVMVAMVASPMITAETTVKDPTASPSPNPEPLDAGVPDSWGYRWINSTGVPSVPFMWVDGVTGGTVVSLQDDDWTGPVSMGIDFTYYGVTYDEVYIMSNGWISFVDSHGHYQSDAFPGDLGYNGVIAPYSRDLQIGAVGEIYYESVAGTPNQFIVTWDNLSHQSVFELQTFQVVLNETGEIWFSYLNLTNPGANVGIENQNNTIGLDYDSMGALSDGLSIMFNCTPNLYQFVTTPDFQMKSGSSPSLVDYTFTIWNGGASNDTYDLASFINDGQTWTVTFRDIGDTQDITNLNVSHGNSTDFIARVSIPGGASAGHYSSALVNVTSQNNTLTCTGRITTQVPYDVGWFDDFDTPTDPWRNMTFAQSSPPTYWQVGDPSITGELSAYSGTNCAGTNVGNYSNNTDIAFLSPLVDLSGPGPYIFTFQTYYNMLNSMDDGGFVEISIDGGPWQTIIPVDDYPSGGVMGGYNQPGYMGIVSGWDWIYQEFDFTMWAGHVVQVRFHFATYPFGGDTPGWYIDDVFIGAPPPYRCELTPDYQENFGHPGEDVDHIFTAVNRGSSNDTYNLTAFSTHGWPVVFRDIGDTMDITNITVPSWDVENFIARVSIPGSIIPPFGDNGFVNITSQNYTASNDTAQIHTFAPIVPPWFDDMESWWNLWTWDNGMGTFWDCGTPSGYGPAAHSGSHCWGANLNLNYTLGGDATLTIPFTDLTSPSLTGANLTFWHWYDMDGGINDGGWVEVSGDQGATWNPITPESGYPDSTSGGQPCYAGQSGSWVEAEFNLSDYLGEIVLIRFHFQDNWDGVERAGWYIDDVYLGATFMDYGVILTPEEDRQIAPDGNSVFYRMTATNIGVAGPDTFLLSNVSVEGWPVRIYDQAMAMQTNTVGPLDYGESEDFWVEVQIPEGAAPMTLETTWVNATSQSDLSANPANDTSTLFTESLAPILVIDDDNGIGSEDWFTNALDANGYKYNYWSLNKSGCPSLDMLNRYKAVIWFTGNTMGDIPTGPNMRADTLSATDRANIESYLSAGGKMYLSGSLLEYDAYNVGNWGSWFEEWFSTQATDQHPAGTPSSGVDDFPTTPQTILGQPGDPIGNGLTLDPHEGDYCPEIMGYYWINHPVGDGVTCFNYTPGLADGTDGAMIRAENGTYGFRTVFSAFDFSEVNNSANRTLLMDRIVNWLLFGEDPNATAFSPISSATNNATPTIRYVCGNNAPASVDIWYWQGDAGGGPWTEWGNDGSVDGTWAFLPALTTSDEYYWYAQGNGPPNEPDPVVFGDAEAGPYTFDIDAPNITSTTPSDGAPNVNIAAGTYVIQFNESMDRTGIPLTTLPILKWSWDSTGMWLNGTYSTLADLTTYYVNLTGQGFYDLAGNDLTGDMDKNFTTGDYTAPTIASTTPADGDVGVSNASGTYVIEFSEPMDTGTVTTIDTNLPGISWSWDGTGIWYNGTYGELAESTKYYVNLTGGFQDNSPNHNPLTGDMDKNFTTGDFTPPTVISTTPVDVAMDIITDADIYIIQFSEPMSNTTGWVNTNLGGPGISWAWDSTGMWYNGSYNNLSDSTLYTLELNNFEDLAGNPLIGDTNKNFTTGAAWATATGPISTGTNNDTPTITYDFGNNAIEVDIYFTKDGGTTWVMWDSDSTVDGTWIPSGAVGWTGTYQWNVRSRGMAFEPVPSGAASIECGDYVLDMDGPRVNSTIPANWDYDINRAAGTYVIEFDEEMDTSHGTVLSTLPGISWDWDSTGMWLNGTYTVLAAETIYYVNLTGQGFVDLVGNALTGQTDMEFKTERSPWAVAGGQTSEGTDNPRPWISYSATGTTGVEIYYTDDGGTTWTLWGTDDNSNGSWTPSTDLPASGTYNWNARALGYVNEPVPSGAASIESGDYVLLSTADTAYITSTTPTDGATSVGLNAGTYVIQFNKVMDNVGSPLSDLPGVTWTWSSNGMWLNGTYSALSASTSYYVNLTGQGFQSTSGYPLIGDMYRIFTTRAADETGTGTVIGQVTDEDGNPIAGATVTIPGTDITATTNETGWYVLEDVPEGDHTLEISHPDYGTQEVDVSVTEGETETPETEQLPPPSSGGGDWMWIIIILIIVVAVVIVGVLFMLRGKGPKESKPSFESNGAEEAAEPEAPVPQAEQPPARTPEAPPPPAKE